MRVRFLRPYDHVAARRLNGTPKSTHHFRAGAEVTVKREWGEAAIADGAAEELEPKPRDGD